MAKVVKLFLSFTAHSINNTFAVSNSKRYDRYNSTHSTNYSVPCRGNTEQHIARKGRKHTIQYIANLLATAVPDSNMSEFTVLRRVKINFSSRLLVALTTLRVLEPAHARQSKINFSSALAYSQVWLILLKKRLSPMYDI